MSERWPGDADALVRWVRAGIRSLAVDGQELRVRGLDRVGVQAAVDGVDVTHLSIDATGADVAFRVNVDDAAPNAVAAEIAPIAEEAGILHDFRLRAQPMRVEGHELRIDLQAHDVPIVWNTYPRPVHPPMPESVHMLEPRTGGGGRGSLDASMRTQDVGPLITALLRPALKEGGIRLSRVALDIARLGPDGIHVRAFLRARWKVLPASARADLVVKTTPDGVITIDDLSLGSSNPLVKTALLFARGYIASARGTRIDLNGMLADSGSTGRIHDLAITTGERFGISARLS